MIIQLTSDDIVKYFDQIKYAASQVNAIDLDNLPVYAQNLLNSFLSGNLQCWVVLSEDRAIKSILITKIYLDIFNKSHLMIDMAYGYSPTTETDKIEGVEELKKFAKNQNITGKDAIIAYTNNQIAVNAMIKMGMKEIYKVFSAEV